MISSHRESSSSWTNLKLWWCSRITNDKNNAVQKKVHRSAESTDNWSCKESMQRRRQQTFNVSALLQPKERLRKKITHSVLLSWLYREVDWEHLLQVLPMRKYLAITVSKGEVLVSFWAKLHLAATKCTLSNLSYEDRQPMCHWWFPSEKALIKIMLCFISPYPTIEKKWKQAQKSCSLIGT